MMYEGAPNWPDFSRFWENHRRPPVTIFYNRAHRHPRLHQVGRPARRKHSLDSLRLLGTVGEPINPEAWMWYREKIGHNRCPIVDTWWQTETGAILIAPIPAPCPPSPARHAAFFGIQPEVVNKEGQPVPAGHGGLLIVRKPWPSMARTIYGDPERLPKDLLERHRGLLLHRRRRTPGRRRLLLADGPRGRCDQRKWPSPWHHGG